MSAPKRFGNSLWGYNKNDVNAYIDTILLEFDDRLKEKDEQINQFKNQYKEFKLKYEEAVKETSDSCGSREKIAEILIKANEKAEKIIKEAQSRANNVETLGENIVSLDKEIVKDVVGELKLIREMSINILKKFSELL